MKHWHNTLLLFFTFQILTEVVLFILFPVFGLRKVWNLPISVHLTLSKMSPYIHWFKENKDLSFKCFMTALFRGKHLPRTQIPLGIRCAGSGTGFFMWTSFPNSFLIICTQGANTVCIWQKQAFGTGETGTALIYQPQHSSTLFNCCIFTNKWHANSMWIPAISERSGKKLPPYLSFQIFQISVVWKAQAIDPAKKNTQAN